MAKKPLPSPELLRQLLRYEPNAGKLFWLPRGPERFQGGRYCAIRQARTWNGRFACKEAFTCRSEFGYARGAIEGHNLKAHRVIWAMQTGKWPTSGVDHRDNDPTNNCWANLRLATQQQNLQNGSSRRGSTSKFLGMSWVSEKKKWLSRIKFDGMPVHIGYFTEETEAAHAYDKAAQKYFGDFANANFRDP